MRPQILVRELMALCVRHTVKQNKSKRILPDCVGIVEFVVEHKDLFIGVWVKWQASYPLRLNLHSADAISVVIINTEIVEYLHP